MSLLIIGRFQYRQQIFSLLEEIYGRDLDQDVVAGSTRITLPQANEGDGGGGG